MFRRLSVLFLASCLVFPASSNALAADCDDDVNNVLSNCTSVSRSVRSDPVVPDGTWQMVSISGGLPLTCSSQFRFRCKGENATSVVALDNAVFGVGTDVPVELQSMSVE